MKECARVQGSCHEIVQSVEFNEEKEARREGATEVGARNVARRTGELRRPREVRRSQKKDRVELKKDRAVESLEDESSFQLWLNDEDHSKFGTPTQECDIFFFLGRAWVGEPQGYAHGLYKTCGVAFEAIPSADIINVAAPLGNQIRPSIE